MPRDSDVRLVYSTAGQPAAKRAPVPEGSPGKASAAVKIRLERRASGRLATVVTGLPGSKGALAELVRTLKAACGAGGTFEAGSFALQGDHRDAVEAALKERGFRPKRAGG